MVLLRRYNYKNKEKHKSGENALQKGDINWLPAQLSGK